LKRNEIVEQYRKIYSNVKKDKLDSSKITHTLDKIPRTSLLLNVVQMLREDYPLPFDEATQERTKHYVFTNDNYTECTNESPLFSIDCEMCFNIDGEMEVVWLAVVNEHLDCVYESFVKPGKKITNYLTKITGVSQKTLVNINTTLHDVQVKLKEILPPNAILVGQSLNNDLHALKCFHPYVIDTSVIFNLSGNRDMKPSLQQLAAKFLGKIIQETVHNPTIDARSSMELVLLKLRRSLEFGDVVAGGCMNTYALDESITKSGSGEDLLIQMGSLDLSDPMKISKFIYQTGMNIDQNFFNVLRDNKISSNFFFV
jgi:RNA exonuclease 1